MKKQFEPISKPDGVPSFCYKDHTYQLLNLGLDIEADSVTYHLSSEFVGDGEMGTVIDMIELERGRRNSA